MSQAQEAPGHQWFYAENGQQKGPLSENEMVPLIKSRTIPPGTTVWRHGFSDWLKLEETELRIHLDNNAPPPLSGEHINNTLVWVLAFAPFIGYALEWAFSIAMHGDNEYAVRAAMASNSYFFITVGLNIALAYFDEKRLKSAGHDTAKFKGWVWIVPVYLYQRAKATKQNLAYFAVWIGCFVSVLLA